jgi:2,4-dienoyl-CoA reductase-like NADH-dependent reductase (Old Yellow Enzyme family)
MKSLADPLDLPCGVRLLNRIAKAAISEVSGQVQGNLAERRTTGGQS